MGIGDEGESQRKGGDGDMDGGGDAGGEEGEGGQSGELKR